MIRVILVFYFAALAIVDGYVLYRAVENSSWLIAVITTVALLFILMAVIGLLNGR